MTAQDVWAANLVAQVDGALSGLSNRVDAAVRGLSWKDQVVAASTATITRAAPGASIDGVALVAGNRILLKNQATASENGIYVWNGASTPLIRAADADTSDELTGATVTVSGGTANKGTVWVQNTPAPILGTTPITWAQVGAGSGVIVDPYMPTGL